MSRLNLALLACCAALARADAPEDWRSRRTPLQGWNAWNTFSVDGKPLRGGRAEYETIAEVLVSAGYRDAGYNVVSTVCTDWIGRDAVGGRKRRQGPAPSTRRNGRTSTLFGAEAGSGRAGAAPVLGAAAAAAGAAADRAAALGERVLDDLGLVCWPS